MGLYESHRFIEGIRQSLYILRGKSAIKNLVIVNTGLRTEMNNFA